MTTYTNVFGGTVVYPAEVSYRAVSLTADTQLSWPTELATDTSVVAQIMDVTANAGPLKLKMPSAIDASVGETTLIFNVGSNDFTVTDTNANTIVSIAPGLAYQIYLIDNTTASGSWRSVQYGAGTSSATAGSLAGQGIKAIGTTLNQSMSVFTFSVNYALGVASDRSALYVWTGGAGTISLPLASDAGNDWFVQVRNSGTGALTVDPAGVDLINGSSSLVLNPGDSAIIACSGTAWFTIGLGKSASFTFDYNSINLTGQPDPYTLSGANLNRIAYNFGGALTANFTVIVPTTIQQYWVTNSTSGGFSITVKPAAGTGITVAAGESAILYCDGVNVVDADTSGIAFPISVANGGTGATTATDARTNLSAAKSGVNADITSITALSAGGASGPAVTFAADPDSGMYSAGVNQLGFSVNGVNAMTLTTSGMNLANALSAANGGTGQTSYTTGDLLYASGATALAKLADVATGNALLSGGVGVAPAWGKIGLTTHVSGTLPVANGGTGVTTSTGSGSVVLSTSPTLVTPTLGVASATSIATGLGAAATPSHTFTGDLNTGFWSPGADNLAASTGGSERFRITLAGNVGIGTTTPDANGKVDILGNIDPGTTPAALSVRNTGVAGGTAVAQYGIRVSSQTYNDSASSYGIYAFSYQNTGKPTYGIWGDAGSSSFVGNSFSPFYGVAGRAYFNSAATNNLTNGTLPVGVYGTVVSTGSTNTAVSAAGYFTNTSTFGSESYGIYVNVATGPTTTIAARFDFAGTEVARIDSAGGILSRGTGGIGYRAGAGGTVAQATSRTTGVTLNKTTGSITLVSAAGTTAWQSFTVTNSTVAATDVIKVVQRSGTDLYMIHVTNVAAGSFQITFATTGGTTTEQPVFNFAVIKGATT